MLVDPAIRAEDEGVSAPVCGDSVQTTDVDDQVRIWWDSIFLALDGERLGSDVGVSRDEDDRAVEADGFVLGGELAI